jgi:hypothetical protein
MSNTPPATQTPDPAQATQQPAQGSDAFGQPQQPATAPPANRPAYGLPAQVTLKPGTFMTVRINEMLASNKSHPGDAFTATLAAPLVADGVVLAQRGQTVYGRVAEAAKEKGVSRLGVELTGLTLADGEQIPIHSQLVSRRGPTTPAGMQAGTIAGTSAVGAAVGAAADWGRGTAIGAGAGAAAGIVGVLVTRNHPSVIYPETMLTFQVQNAVTVATGNAPRAFRFVGPEDYDRPAPATGRSVPTRPYVYGPAYGPGYYPGYYPYYPYSYWGGPSIFFGFGGGYGRYGFGGFRRWR